MDSVAIVGLIVGGTALGSAIAGIIRTTLQVKKLQQQMGHLRVVLKGADGAQRELLLPQAGSASLSEAEIKNLVKVLSDADLARR